MMKKLLSLLLVLPFTLQAQWTGEIRSAYLYSPQWDDVIQTYNLSRPWHDDTLEPWTMGYGGTLGYNWKLVDFRQIHMVPHLGYYRYASSVQVNDEKISAGFHTASFGLQFRFHPKAIFKGIQVSGPLGPRWFMTITPSYNVFLPFLRRDKKLYSYAEDEPYRPASTSFSLQLGTGYHLFTFWNFIVTGEAGITWYPYVELYDFAEMLHGQNILGMSNEAYPVLLGQASLRLTWIRPQTEWWERPVE